MRACSGSYTPHGRSQWARAVVVGASQRVSRDMGLLLSLGRGPSTLSSREALRSLRARHRPCQTRVRRGAPMGGTARRGYHRPDDGPRAAQRGRFTGLPVRRVRRRSRRACRSAGPPPPLFRRGRAGTARARPPGGVLPLVGVPGLPDVPGVGSSGGCARDPGRPRRRTTRISGAGGMRQPRSAQRGRPRRSDEDDADEDPVEPAAARAADRGAPTPQSATRLGGTAAVGVGGRRRAERAWRAASADGAPGRRAEVLARRSGGRAGPGRQCRRPARPRRATRRGMGRSAVDARCSPRPPTVPRRRPIRSWPAWSVARGIAGARSAEHRIADVRPPRDQAGRRPTVSSTRDRNRERDRDRERAAGAAAASQHDGPSWEQAAATRPTRRSRPGPGSGHPRHPDRRHPVRRRRPGRGRSLFFLPGLLGVGGGTTRGAAPSASPSSAATIRLALADRDPRADAAGLHDQGRRHALEDRSASSTSTLDALLAANKDTIKNPNRIRVGDEIIIPLPETEQVPAEASASPSAREPPSPSAGRPSGASAGAMLIAVIRPASTRNVASMCWVGAPGPDDEQVRLVGVAGVPDLARDHPQAGVAAQEPAADALDAAQRLDVVTDVDAHLGLLVHQRDRALAIAARSASRRTLPSSRQHPWPECSVGRPWPPSTPPRTPLDGGLAALRAADPVASTSSSGCRPTRISLALLEVAKAGIHPPDEMPFGVAWTDAPRAAFDHGFLAAPLGVARRRGGRTTGGST